MTLTQKDWLPRNARTIPPTVTGERPGIVDVPEKAWIACSAASAERFEVPIRRVSAVQPGCTSPLPAHTQFLCEATPLRSSLPSRAKPDFFIVGAPKCGTTALTHYLATHPDVFMAPKELHAFGADLQFGRQFYRRDLRNYLAEFASRNGERCAGEASVWYLFSEQAAAEIKQFNPESRIIIMLRNPAEMLYSLYYQFRFDGNEHLPTFEEALAAEPERRAGRLIGRRSYFARGLLYRETARYAGQVRRYLEAFGREQVLVLLYDQFSANPAAAYCRTLDFLGVDSTHLDVPFKVINASRRIRNRALNALLTEPLLRRIVLQLRPCVPRFLFRALREADARLRQRNTVFQQRPPMPGALRARLKREFGSEVERLSELLDRDLTYWTS